MDLVLKLNGQEVARVKIFSPVQFTREIENLRMQHKDLINNEGVKPEFCIENIPPGFNQFQPLG